MDVGTLGTMNNPSEINPPSEFLALLDVTQKTAVQNGIFQKNHKASIQTVIYGIVLIRGGDIKNQVNRYTIYIIGFYTILRL